MTTGTNSQNDILIIGWCDNGFTDSLFTSNTMSIVAGAGGELGISGLGICQTIGNQIANQRKTLLSDFINMDGDWLLWIDSDIVPSMEALKLLWENRNAETHPVISGVYFVSMEMNMTLPKPIPCIFVNKEDGKVPVHPLPENQLIPIDAAGLGFCLMHKSVAHKLYEAYKDTVFQITIDTKHVSEDIAFFKKLKELNIPTYAHTGALVQHIKRFSIDYNYYNLWWHAVAPLRIKQEGDNK